MKNAVTAVYFGRCLQSELVLKFNVNRKKIGQLLAKLPSGLLENTHDFNRKVIEVVGIGNCGLHQQYSEKELKDALFAFASQSALKADISHSFGIPERTLFDKRSELMQKLGIANKVVLKHYALTQPEQLWQFISEHDWMGKTNTAKVDSHNSSFAGVRRAYGSSDSSDSSNGNGSGSNNSSIFSVDDSSPQ